MSIKIIIEAVSEETMFSILDDYNLLLIESSAVLDNQQC